MVPVLGGAEHPETPPMTRPAVVRSLILGCAGELDAVTFAGVVATATKQEQHECARQLAESWLARDRGRLRSGREQFEVDRERCSWTSTLTQLD
jgi:hypothetical protein